MKILTRYVIRSHVGPFLFAFTAVTGLLFLNAIAQRLEDLAGRGLEWSVIGEFVLLSLPHIVALTFPMSILVAVLYAFSELTGNNEVAAMASGGIHPIRLMLPLLGVGLVLAGLMFVFNDRILPESNHRLSSLLTDIGSQSPTFELREEVVNEIPTGDGTRYFLRARSIDPTENHLQDVEIFDLSQPGETRTIVANEGRMAFTADQRDLYLTLEEGVVYSVSDERPGTFQRLNYRTQVLPLRGVTQEMERRTSGRRGEREMTVSMLQTEVDQSLSNLRRLAEDSYEASMTALELTLAGRMGEDQEALLEMARLEAEEAAADELESESEIDVDQAMESMERPELGNDEVIEDVAGLHRVNQLRWRTYELSSYRHEVEIQKKYAIAFACLIFVLLGPPLAIRYPQGGVGMVIASSVGIFFFYWMGLIGGERLADRGQMDPVLAMWAPNVILLIPALYLLTRVGDEISTNRGSTWDAFAFRVRDSVRRIRQRPEPEGEAWET